MQGSKLKHVFLLEYRTPDSQTGWAARPENARWELSVDTPKSVYELAAVIALTAVTREELGVRVTYLGVVDSAWPNSMPTSACDFHLEICHP